MVTRTPIEELARNFHHRDPEVLADPWPVYERLRNECPVAHSERYGGFWVLSRYADVVAAAQDTDAFSSAQGVVIPSMCLKLPLIPFEIDPPRHTEFRRLLMRRFSPQNVEQLEPFTIAEANRLIDGFAEAGCCDLINDYALPLTSAVFGKLLSLPISDRMKIARWTNCIMERVADPAGAAVAIDNLLAYLEDLIARRHKEPKDDILGILMSSEVEGRPITHEELLAMCFTFVLAGLETTIVAMGGSLLHLSHHPEMRARLLADDKLFATFVEEFLRMEPPAHAHVRTLRQDVELHGQKLQAGEQVMLLWAAANRDEDRFDCPVKFQEDRRPNRHLSFGVGRHRCIGSHLASMEIRVATTCLARRFPEYHVPDDSQVSNFETARGPRALPVKLS